MDAAAVGPLPASQKIYVEGSRADIRVPMREITQSETPASFGAEKNPPLAVYDTSGPYTDPTAKIDIRRGLAPLRAAWIAERGDTIELDGPTSGYGRARLADPELAGFRFDLLRTPRRAVYGKKRLANALRETRHHYAGDGVCGAAREPEARDGTVTQYTENAAKQVKGGHVRGRAAKVRHARIRPRGSRRGRAIIPGNVNHPESEPMIIGRNFL